MTKPFLKALDQTSGIKQKEFAYENRLAQGKYSPPSYIQRHA